MAEIWTPLAEWPSLLRLSGIYVIRNTVTGQEYVGKSVDIRGRLKIHANAAKGQRLHRAVQKHGLAAFSFLILHADSRREDLCDFEVSTITSRNTYGMGGYNDTRGGDGGWEGKRHSPESRAKMTQVKLAKPLMLGRHHTPEAKARISRGNLGRKISEESRQLFSKVQMGREVSKETREKQRIRLSKPVLVWPPECMVPLEFPSQKAAAAWAGCSSQAIGNWVARGAAPKLGNYLKHPAQAQGCVWAYAE